MSIPTPYTLLVREPSTGAEDAHGNPVSGWGAPREWRVQNAGPFGQMHVYDTRSGGGGRLYPTEIRDLQKLCRLHSGIGSGRKAFTVAPR